MRAMCIEALDRAIAIVGSQSIFASRLGIRCASISGWRKRRRIPVDRCLAIESMTAGAVTRYDLRPDVFGEAPAAAMREAG